MIHKQRLFRNLVHVSPSKRPGFVLLDSVISLAIISFVILIYAGLARTRLINHQVSVRATAETLADEEIGLLRRIDATTLATQTNGSFINAYHNAGTWTIQTDATNLDTTTTPCPPAAATKHCGSSVLELARNTAMTGTTSGRLLFPAGTYGGTTAIPVTLQANWKVATDSPAGWAIGYTFRATNTTDTYRLRMGDISTDLDTSTNGTQNVLLEKIVTSVATKIFSVGNISLTTNTWNTLAVRTADTSLKIYLNGVQLDNGTLVDTAFTTGAAALIGWGGVHAFVDDVIVTVGSNTSTWSFEGSTSLPAAWLRLGLNDLRDSTQNVFDDNGTLTIAPYPDLTSTNLKIATVTVSWTESGRTESYTTSALLGRSRLAE